VTGRSAAAEKHLSLAERIAGIDDERREGENLSAALRIRVLDWALGR
jgi:predicted DNA-binding ribbon-helix-helix protein